MPHYSVTTEDGNDSFDAEQMIETDDRYIFRDYDDNIIRIYAAAKIVKLRRTDDDAD